ncbi:hypothetical protein [Oceanicella actignis]|uniref:Uncharacterized protein n=1 Tax=Oceanicella actignis TaxID=1189325 RepID=A0A1M7RR01_9RHOB|nr:hypothetical protein [Oceanicella actignis]SET07853.1 hypothetical protein SAMN04488119_102505 [Oceanicella actignis]SHN48743.1 hypothetical protein SAMN05216200_10113 [Oceanicella actignis]
MPRHLRLALTIALVSPVAFPGAAPAGAAGTASARPLAAASAPGGAGGQGMTGHVSAPSRGQAGPAGAVHDHAAHGHAGQGRAAHHDRVADGHAADGHAAHDHAAHGHAAMGAQAAAFAPPRAPRGGRMIEVAGEVIDSWCYLSGVMGGPEAVTGSAHHACALWCAAGGIPVALLADDGAVHMVLKWEGDDHVAGGEMIMDAQSRRVRARGLSFARDGVRWLLVERVLTDEGVVRRSHEEYGVVPAFAIPEPAAQGEDR